MTARVGLFVGLCHTMPGGTHERLHEKMPMSTIEKACHEQVTPMKRLGVKESACGVSPLFVADVLADELALTSRSS
jgi:hypothetical protein